MFENLKQPYPFQNKVKHNLKTIGLVTMGSMLVLLYFQPFGINFLETPKSAYFVLIAGVCTAAILFLNSVIVPGIMSKIFDTRRWTVGKEIVWNVWIFACLSSIYIVLALVFRFAQITILPLWSAGALAGLPITLLNLVNYNAQLKHRVVKAIDEGRHFIDEKLNETQPNKIDQKSLQFSSESGREVLEIEAEQLLVVRSSSNYIEIYWKEEEVVKHHMLRNRFSVAESILANKPGVRKCHRCYLVNVQQISRVVRNSSSTRLQFSGINFDVPVARAYQQNFRHIRV